METTAIVLPKLTKISRNDPENTDYEFVNNLTLADPSFLNDSEIDIILGAAEYAKIIKIGLMKSEGLVAQNTELGWVISGATNMRGSMYITTLVSNAELHQSLRCFFCQDEFENETSKPLTEEEQYCEKYYNETTVRNQDGKLVVPLPFKNGINQPNLGDSRKCAITTQLQLEKRFVRNRNLENEYFKFIKEGIKLGHIETVRASPGKNLRVVYNASQKTANGKSLNDHSCGTIGYNFIAIEI